MPNEPPAAHAGDVCVRAEVDRWSARALGLVVSFIALGVGLRLVRFVMNFPFYGDEAALAANFLDRDYAGLFKPLDYSQVSSLGFLWGELAVTQWLGFSELSLRAIPLLAGLASLLLFAVLARQVLGSTIGWVIAVAVFAVSRTLLRYSAEIKPYSLDLLIATALMCLAAWGLRSDRPARAIWLLMLATPAAIFGSLPSIFVLGAIIAILFLCGLIQKPAGWMAPTLALTLVAGGSFVSLYLFFLAPHHDHCGASMEEFWSLAFPPIDGPLNFSRWFLETHTGRLLAYPIGDKNGGSIATFYICIVGIWGLARKSRGMLLLLIGPFLLTFLAALVHRYPYGGSPRITQHLVPAICILLGAGVQLGLTWIQRERFRVRVAQLSLISLAILGTAMTVGTMMRPYVESVDPWTRDYCRSFWAKQENAQATLVVGTSFDHDRQRGILHREAVWRCYHAMYAPAGSLCVDPATITKAGNPPETVVLHLVDLHEDRRKLAEEWMAGLRESGRVAGETAFDFHSDIEKHAESVHVLMLTPATSQPDVRARQAAKVPAQRAF